jgi:hypothetical protein
MDPWIRQHSAGPEHSPRKCTQASAAEQIYETHLGDCAFRPPHFFVDFAERRADMGHRHRITKVGSGEAQDKKLDRPLLACEYPCTEN